MRKILAVLALMLLCGQAWADVAVRTGTVTLANMRLSAVDGTAFVDFSAAGVLTQLVTSDNRYRLKITDSAGKSIEGYPKAIGPGETYGTQMFTADTTFTTATGWGLDAPYVAISGGKATWSDGTTIALYQNGLTSTTYGLYCAGLTVSDRTNGAISLFQGYATTVFGHATASDGVKKLYVTSVGSPSRFGFIGRSDFRGSIDDVSLRSVLTPSATGVTIVSTRGGSTQSWASQDAGFNYNDASGYTYTIYRETPYTLINPTYQMPRAK